MCGIAGYIGKGRPTQEQIEYTLTTMRNRGPNNYDYKYFDYNGSSCVLLHSRLSIIDLDERSNQPFTLNGCTIVFNGEIYNYKELRSQLPGEYLTDSDTEVLLRYYLRYGEKCIEHFEGMWAFAIYDTRSDKLFLSRDRFAEKPLYLYENARGLYFASEIKQIKALSGDKLKINALQLKRSLTNGYRSLYKQNESFYQNVKRLPYASSLNADLNAKINEYRYWTPTCQRQEMSMQDAIDGTRERLIESVRLRLRADVPLAFCLSGGIDSNAIVGIASKIFNYDVKTFSIIENDARYDERENIQATVDYISCDATYIKVSTENTLERLRELINYHDQPIATITYLIHSMLSEQISKQGYKISVSGSAADELFTGYYDYHCYHLLAMHGCKNFQEYYDQWRANTGKVVRNPYLSNPELFFKNPMLRDYIYLNNDEFSDFMVKPFSEDFFEEEFAQAEADSMLRKRMFNDMFHETVPVILNEDDLNSMLYSVENRSPFLDKDLFEFAHSIPVEHLIHDGYGKYILREAMKGLITDKVRLDRQKKGFNASLLSLVDFSDKTVKDELLADSPVFEYIRKDKINTLMQEKTLPNSYSKFLFNFINAKYFLEMNS